VPGLYEIHAYLNDRAGVAQTVELQAGRVTDLGTITFKKGSVLRGKCVDVEGQPRNVEACLVPVPDDASTGAGHPHHLYALKMDDQGLFSSSSLPVGRYLVRIPCSMPRSISEGESGWTTAPMLIDTRDGPVENVVIIVQRPVATILRPISSEMDGMKYNVVTTTGLSYCDGGFRGSASERLDLAPGSYTLRLTRGNDPVRELPLTVGSSPMTIEVGP
jgi:hypothetical protein